MGGREGRRAYLAGSKLIDFLSIHCDVAILSLVRSDAVDFGRALRLVLGKLKVEVALA